MRCVGKLVDIRVGIGSIWLVLPKVYVIDNLCQPLLLGINDVVRGNAEFAVREGSTADRLAFRIGESGWVETIRAPARRPAYVRDVVQRGEERVTIESEPAAPRVAVTAVAVVRAEPTPAAESAAAALAPVAEVGAVSSDAATPDVKSSSAATVSLPPVVDMSVMEATTEPAMPAAGSPLEVAALEVAPCRRRRAATCSRPTT